MESYWKNEHICGRPLGLRFDKKEWRIVHCGCLLWVDEGTKVLMRNMVFPNGLSLSKDRSFFVFTEAGRLRRYGLKGEKSGTSDIFVDLTGSPDNVRANENRERFG
ncbi:hypothetical protein QQ045_003013 [Rhodiola kirilowii]